MGSSTLKALLISDIQVDHLIFSTMLNKFEIETTVAWDGQEAVAMFLAGNKFDIILSDNLMANMTGPEAIVKIRAMGATDVMIVGVTADDNCLEAFMGAGADVFVPKPLRLETLEDIVEEVRLRKKK